MEKMIWAFSQRWEEPWLHPFTSINAFHSIIHFHQQQKWWSISVEMDGMHRRQRRESAPTSSLNNKPNPPMNPKIYDSSWQLLGGRKTMGRHASFRDEKEESFRPNLAYLRRWKGPFWAFENWRNQNLLFFVGINKKVVKVFLWSNAANYGQICHHWNKNWQKKNFCLWPNLIEGKAFLKEFFPIIGWKNCFVDGEEKQSATATINEKENNNKLKNRREWTIVPLPFPTLFWLSANVCLAKNWIGQTKNLMDPFWPAEEEERETNEHSTHQYYSAGEWNQSFGRGKS